MICPQTKLECVKPQVCNAGRLCAQPPDMAEIERLAGDGQHKPCPTRYTFVTLGNGDIVQCDETLSAETVVDIAGNVAPFVIRDLTKPTTMAEIERLLGEYVGWCIEANEGGLKDSLANDAVDVARAALMAAIRSLSNSAQKGE